MLQVDEVVEGYRAGDRLEYRITIKDGDGALMDDAGINVEQKDPFSTVTNYDLSDPELTNISTGVYDFIKDLLVVGDWLLEFRLSAGQSLLVYVPVSGSVNVGSINTVLSGFSSGFSNGFGGK